MSLMNLMFSAKNSGFFNPFDGKFAQATDDNPLKMMDVGPLSGDPTPRFEFRDSARVGAGRLLAGAK